MPGAITAVALSKPVPSLLKRKASAPTGEEPSPVQQARTRARRRLIGAVVLLALGVVIFPMLFETKPRPVPVDIPIEIARRDTPAALRPAPIATPPVARPAPVPADASNEAAAPSAAVVPAPAPDPSPAVVAPPKPEAAASAVADAASALKSGRFVVQVGAFTDPTSLREARQKVEKLGLKTYTQVIETEAGKRTRVRVGPFDARDEAERAAGRLKSAGLPANILVL